jgi:hypothetical protein
LTAPLVLPLLPPEQYVAYEKAVGITPPKTEVAHRGSLPQLFGDQFGMGGTRGRRGPHLPRAPREEQAKAAIFANNYGEAGAVNLFGPKYGLPRAISAHQSHYFWGPQGYTGEVLIVLQDRRERMEEACTSVERAGEHFHPWGMAEENGPIFVCRGLKWPLAEVWPKLKKWN